MKTTLTSSTKHFAKKLLFQTPANLKRNHIRIDDTGFDAIEKSLQQHFYKKRDNADSPSKNCNEDDLNAHKFRRLESDRCLIIPWLDKSRSLDGMKILEIGCGTGSSAVSLAEQGAIVTGIDVNEGALKVAEDRVKIYNIKANFSALNASEIASAFSHQKFDMIIFFASLEHMTISERLTSLRDAWKILDKNGLLVIAETPNRLWYFDGHTSMLPFYHWLPDDLAFEYSRFSPRNNFREIYRENTERSKHHFLRRGRGMSYHELDIAIRPAHQLNVISSFSSYAKWRYKLKLSRSDRQYRSLLKKMNPSLHEGFFDDTLYLIIEKDQ